MKQTNSAIKFLLAQYRAVFKHAQLASILAVAAASALSIGQAQAAAGGATFGNDKLAAADADVTVDGTTTDQSPSENSYGTLTLTGGAERTSEQAITITINKGEGNTIKGVDAKASVNLNNASVTIAKAGSDAAKLTIGESGAVGGTPAATATHVTLKNLTVSSGALDLVAASGEGKETTVNAADVIFGAGAPTGSGQQETATVDIAGNSSLSASTLLVKQGATVKVADNASLLATGDVTVESGSISLGKDKETSGASFGSTTGALIIKDGTVEAASGGVGLLKGKVSLEGGTLQSSGTLTLEGGLKAKGGTIKVAGATNSLTLKGGATLDAAVDLQNSGSLVLDGGQSTIAFAASSAIDAGASLVLKNGATADMEHATFAKLASGTVKSDTGHVGSIILKDATEIDLASGDSIITGTAGQDQGKLNDKLQGGDTGLTLRIEKAKYTSGDKVLANTNTGKLKLSIGELTLGSKGGTDPVLVSGASIEITKALKTTDDKALKIVGDGSLGFSSEADATLASKSITLGDATSGAGNLVVSKGNWTTNELTVTSGTASVSNGAKLTLTKGLTTAGDKGKLVVTGVGSTVDAKGVEKLSLASGGVALSSEGTLILNAKAVLKDDKTLNTDNFKAGAVEGSTDTHLNLMSGDAAVSMSVEQYQKFRETTKFTGLFNISVSGDVAVKDQMALGGQGGVIGGLEKEEYKGVQGKVESAKGVTDNYYVGNVVSDGTGVDLNKGGALTLANANANNAKGQYVTNKDGGVGTVTFKDSGNSLTLAGAGGKVGAITNSNDGDGTVNIGKGSAVEVVSGSIGTAVAGSPTQGTPGAMKNVNVLDGGSLTLESGSVYSNNLSLGTGSGLNVGTGEVVVKEHAAINGDVKAGSLTLSGTVASGTNAGIHSIAGDAYVDVSKLSVGAGNILTVGDDGEPNKPETSTSATVFTETLDLGAGGILFVDPSYKVKATVFAAKNITTTAGATGVNVVNGSLLVGANAALGVGYSVPELNNVIDPYLNDNRAFDEMGRFNNALAINAPIQLKKDAGIAVDATLTDEKVKDPSSATAYQNKLVLGGKSNLIVSDKAFGPDKTGAAITFFSGETTKPTSSAQVTADEGAVITLVGNISAADKNLKLFAVDSKATGASLELATNSKGILVEAAGGLISQKITDTAGLSAALNLSPDKEVEKHIRTVVSAPVADMFVDYSVGKFAGQSGSGFDFMVNNLTAKKFEVVDVAAHAATYAGAQQAAVAAVTTMAEAVGSRVSSIGVESSAITATGSQANGGVWLTPMYKSVDADGFGAQGVSYGADVDLAGVAFGADTVNGAMRFGAVFNIGSGDSDGKGMGSGLKDEFDYYGFGIYSVMGFGQFSLVGDASLNVISHEVEAAGLGVKAKADTTAVTMGITGQYAISTSSVDVVPHLGARFIRLDTDSYDLVDASDAFASTDFEVQNVYSIPLGVSISKAIEMGGWSLAPSADFSITFNTGDVEVDSTTRFTGLNHNLGLSTEVLDEVTYGVAVGLGAQYGAFGTHIGLNYTGSENTDSFGVNAQARYMF